MPLPSPAQQTALTLGVVHTVLTPHSKAGRVLFAWDSVTSERCTGACHMPQTPPAVECSQRLWEVGTRSPRVTKDTGAAQGHTTATEQGSDTREPVSCSILGHAVRDRDGAAWPSLGEPPGSPASWGRTEAGDTPTVRPEEWINKHIVPWNTIH